MGTTHPIRCRHDICVFSSLSYRQELPYRSPIYSHFSLLCVPNYASGFMDIVNAT
jgi:hypothetical protein